MRTLTSDNRDIPPGAVAVRPEGAGEADAVGVGAHADDED